jgi:xylulokinase
MKGILAFDVGTTAVKIGLFTEDLKLIDFVIKEYTLLTPMPDIVELDPAVYWNNAIIGTREVLIKTGFPASEIVCITCTTQGETLIPVDENVNPLYNAIVWLDSRASREGSYIARQFSKDYLYTKTGVPEVNAYTPLSKMLWLKNNEPDIYRKACKLLLLEDFLVAKLCGRFVTNPSVICSTAYFDINTSRVWEEILENLGLDKNKIPELLPCGAIAGKLKKEAAVSLGLPAGIAIATSAMDQVTAAIGARNIREGVLVETTGTAQVVTTTQDMPHTDIWKPVFIYSHGVPGKYLSVLIIQSAGIVYKWFREEFCNDLAGPDRFRQMDELAEKESPGSKGLLLSPYFTGTQFPVTSDNTRGVFLGIGLDTNRACFIRAIMESIGYTMLDCIELLGVKPSMIISLGGGAKSRIWNQIKADISQTEIITMDIEEASLFGAAILGSIAVGIFPGIEAACGLAVPKHIYRPNPDNKQVYKKAYCRYRKMQDQLVSLF